MFYYGIKFHGISHENINLFIREILDIKQNNILNSHFYTDDLGDFVYSDKTDLSAVCQGSFAAVMNVKMLSFHRIYHNVLCLASASVVESLKNHTARKRAVTDNRYNMVTVASQCFRFCKAQTCRNRGCTVSAEKYIVFTFRRSCKAGDSSLCSDGGKSVISARKKLVGIALMPDVEHESVCLCIKNPVQRHGQLHSAQIRSQMAAVSPAQTSSRSQSGS